MWAGARARLSVVGRVACRLVGVRAVEVPEVVERVLIRRGVLDGGRADITGDFVAPGLGLDLVDAQGRPRRRGRSRSMTQC